MAIDKLLTASFRGFEFPVISSSNDEGNDIVVHDYVGSGRRYIEYVGGNPPEFNLTAIIHGEDAFKRATDFRAVLNRVGPGLLVHPERGQYLVSVGKYSSSTKDTEIGKVVFNIPFYTDDGAVFPTIIQDNNEAVSSSADKARNIIEDEFNDQYELPGSDKSSETLIDKIGELGDSLEQATKDAIGDQELLDNISFTISELQDLKTQLVRQPSRLISKIKGIHSDLKGLKVSYSNLMKLSTFGISESVLDPLNIDRVNRQRSLDVMNQTNRINNYISSVEQISSFDFTITDQVESARSLIKDSYENIIDDDFVKQANNFKDAEYGLNDSVFSVDNDDREDSLFSLLQNMQRSCLSILDDESVSLPSIEEIEIEFTTTLTRLCYDLYGNLDNLDQIMSLNPSQDPTMMTGRIRVIQ